MRSMAHNTHQHTIYWISFMLLRLFNTYYFSIILFLRYFINFFILNCLFSRQFCRVRRSNYMVMCTIPTTSRSTDRPTNQHQQRLHVQLSALACTTVSAAPQQAIVYNFCMPPLPRHALVSHKLLAYERALSQLNACVCVCHKRVIQQSSDRDRATHDRYALANLMSKCWRR